jgi:hypothetical protein
LGKFQPRHRYAKPEGECGNVKTSRWCAIQLQYKIRFIGSKCWTSCESTQQLNNSVRAGNLDKYIETIEKFLEFDADKFVCGHLNKVGTRAEMEQALEFVQDVKKAAQVWNPIL